jgi:hypothetical protein
MKAIRIALVTGTLGFCLLALWLRLRAGDTAPRSAVWRFVMPPPPRNACQVERREAGRCLYRAQIAVIAQLERLEAWDPEATDGRAGTRLYQELMAEDKDDCLRRARANARWAAALAITPADRYKSAELLYTLERYAGNDPAALQAARTMVATAPRKRVALMLLQRAAQSCGDRRLERQATAALNALPPLVAATLPPPTDQRSLPTARPNTPLRAGGKEYEFGRALVDRDDGLAAGSERSPLRHPLPHAEDGSPPRLPGLPPPPLSSPPGAD